MTTVQEPPLTLGDSAARQLANATKTTAQLSTITPRWLAHLLQWVPVEAGIYRLNQVKNPEAVDVACPPRDERSCRRPSSTYEEQPREYFLNAVSTVLDVHTRVSDLYSSPYDQIKEQLRLTIETIKERQEAELINNPDYGLLANVADEQRVFPLTGAPTPGRPRRAAHEGLEGAGILPDALRSRSPRSAASARGAACRRRRSACSARSSSRGAASR